MAIDLRGLDAYGGSDPRGIAHGVLTAENTGGYTLTEGKYDTACYYRNPLGFRDGTESLWISYGSADAQFMLRRIRDMGYQALTQYGNCPGFGPPNKLGHRDRIGSEIWTPILTHPQGPGEFPADQVKVYRWHRPNGLPGSLKGAKISFPRLVEAVKRHETTVQEIGCPDCTRITFWEPWMLARHLQVSHNYSPSMVFEIGDQMGVDFRRDLRVTHDLIEETDLSALEGHDLDADDPEYVAAIQIITPQSVRPRPVVVPPIPAPVYEPPAPDPALLAELERLRTLNAMLLAGQAMEQANAAPPAVDVDPDPSTQAVAAGVIERRGPGRPRKVIADD